MAVFIVLWPYLLTTNLRSMIRHNLGHSVHLLRTLCTAEPYSFLQKIYHPIVNGGANFTHFEHANYFFSSNKPKPSLKIRTANAIFWTSLGIFRDYGLNNIFLGIKLFLFFKIESWNFQYLFVNEVCETSQKFNSIKQPIEKMKITIVWMSWILWDFTKFCFKQMLKVSAFYLEK